MPSLSLIAIEAKRLNKPLPESRGRVLQAALVERCEAHWRALRGPQPDTSLEQALWSITPPWSDLLVDLYASGDPRLDELLPGGHLAKGLALLVLAEIERGNEQGAHIAHEPMMAFEETPPPAIWFDRIASLLRGVLVPPPLHLHASREPLWKALAVVAEDTRRPDLPAVLKVISLLTETGNHSVMPREAALERLRQEVRQVGIRFLGIDKDCVQLEQHGHVHKAVRTRRLGEMLLEIRQQWLR